MRIELSAHPNTCVREFPSLETLEVDLNVRLLTSQPLSDTSKMDQSCSMLMGSSLSLQKNGLRCTVGQLLGDLNLGFSLREARIWPAFGYYSSAMLVMDSSSSAPSPL